MERIHSATPQPNDLPTLVDINVAQQDLNIEPGPIYVQEVKDAIKKLKNGKEPGDYNV